MAGVEYLFRWKPAAFFAACFAIAFPSLAGEPDIPAKAEEVTVERRAVPVAGLASSIVAHPDLRLTGAWELSAKGAKFGGISSMTVLGEKLLLLSDSGKLFRFDASDASPAIRTEARDLPPVCAASARKGDPDSESLSASPDGSELRIGLERSNTLCAFSFDSPGDARLVQLSAIRNWPRNQGAESMANFPGWGMAIIGEGALDELGARPLLWYSGDVAKENTSYISMKYTPPSGYKPGDAAFLPDGRMLVLDRKVGAMGRYATMLNIVAAFLPKEGAILVSKPLAQIEGVSLAGNYEGLAVKPHAGGTTIWLVTDDNYFPGRKTMMLQFELDDSPAENIASSMTAEGGSGPN